MAWSEPPQSTSVSVPFFTPSVGEGDAHRPPAHTPLMQSLGCAHALPSAHAGAPSPPQSTSVSDPFFTPSVADAATQRPETQCPPPQVASLAQASPDEGAPLDPPSDGATGSAVEHATKKTNPRPSRGRSPMTSSVRKPDQEILGLHRSEASQAACTPFAAASSLEPSTCEQPE